MASLKTLNQLDLNLLKVLEAMYQHRNLTRAAEALNITPSAVSHALKRLRDSLDDPLFERRGQQMTPTPVCRRLVPEVLQTLNTLRRSLQSFGEFSPETSTQALQIAIHDALEPLLFPLLLTVFRNTAPLISLSSVKLDRSQLEHQLEIGEVDFAIDIARPLSAPIEHLPLSQSGFCVLGNESIIPTDELTTETYGQAEHIVVSNRPTGKVIEDLAFAQLGFNRKVVVRCQNYPTAIRIVKTMPLLLTLPESIAIAWETSGLQRVALPFEVPQTETRLYWHALSVDDPLLLWARQRIMTAVNTTL
ncbi:LysR family transcriptional regulator [Reinekea blandensis]|uniref:Probable transcription regulator protein n=1 Tax=Reinekea blandensis MED297 TaxID=314283 RepID=A4BGW0_9GAMM|nr:LysR family transcriptional regulator [Reinekea blandensis]EAR08606.1 probable transcription regulator protein [Reinekea sp. MED297] [Reinekea blandensis MED297]